MFEVSGGVFWFLMTCRERFRCKHTPQTSSKSIGTSLFFFSTFPIHLSKHQILSFNCLGFLAWPFRLLSQGPEISNVEEKADVDKLTLQGLWEVEEGVAWKEWAEEQKGCLKLLHRTASWTERFLDMDSQSSYEKELCPQTYLEPFLKVL